MIFKPVFIYTDNGIEHGVLSPFETKETILQQGEQIAPGFKPLDCDIRYLKDIAVKMRAGITIYTDILLPDQQTRLNLGRAGK